MNVEQTEQHIAVMQAALDGEQIQCRERGNSKPWIVVSDIVWNFSEFEYRIMVDQEKEAYRVYLEGFNAKSQYSGPIDPDMRNGLRALIDAVKRGEIQ